MHTRCSTKCLNEMWFLELERSELYGDSYSVSAALAASGAAGFLQLGASPILPSLKPRKNRRSRSSCFSCCCCCLILFLILLLCVLLFGLVFFFWFNPKLPTFHIQSFRLTAFNITAKSDGNYLTAKTVTRIEVKNPNEKITFYYGATAVDVRVGQGGDETDLGTANLGNFIQEKENITSLKIETKVDNQLVDNETGNRLLKRFKRKELKTKVDVQTKFGVGLGAVKVRMLGVRVNCGGTMKELDDSSKKEGRGKEKGKKG